MPPSAEDNTIEYIEPEMGKAIETEQYRATLLKYLDELTYSEQLLKAYALKGKDPGDVLNTTVSQMVSIMQHIIPKLKGSAGEESKVLLEKFEPYQEWMANVIMAKASKNEVNKIPDLFNLILEAYNLLGITNI